MYNIAADIPEIPEGGSTNFCTLGIPTIPELDDHTVGESLAPDLLIALDVIGIRGILDLLEDTLITRAYTRDRAGDPHAAISDRINAGRIRRMKLYKLPE